MGWKRCLRAKTHHLLRLYVKNSIAVAKPKTKSKIPTMSEIATTKNSSLAEENEHFLATILRIFTVAIFSDDRGGRPPGLGIDLCP